MNLAFAISLASLVAIGVPFWWRGLTNVVQGRELIQRRERIPSPIGFLDVLITFLFWAMSQAIAVSVLALYFSPEQLTSGEALQVNQITLMLAIGLAQVAGTLLALLIIGFRHGHAPRIFGIQSEFIVRDIGIGFVAFAMVIPPLLVLQWFLGHFVEYKHSTIETLRENFSFNTMAVTWLTAVIFAPLVEEFFFRGILQSWLGRIGRRSSVRDSLFTLIGGFYPEQHSATSSADTQKLTNSNNATALVKTPIENPYLTPTSDLGSIAQLERGQMYPFVRSDSSSKWMPIVVSAAMFGLVHLGQGLAPVALFVFGLALGYLYRQTGSITICIVLHLLLNAFSMFWITFELCFE